MLFLFAFLFGMAVQGAFSQSVLSPGDVAIVNVNADDDDNFDFVPLVDIDAGTEIYFTDNAYIESNGSLETNEGTITFTASSSISAGTVVSYSGSDGNGFEQTSGNYSASVSGDNLIVYQDDGSITYLLGAGWARGSSVWTYSSTSSSNRSDIPPGLSEVNNTILSLGTGDNYRYSESNGIEGTANTLLSLIGDETHWDESDETAFSSFSYSLTLLAPPTVAFTTSSLSVDETATSIDLTVELVEPNSTAINVDVVFLPGSSTADASDISNYITTPVSFGEGATDGATQTVTVILNDDDDFEGVEKAVFQLQNNSTGSIIAPSELTLSISDDDQPNIIINEIYYDPVNNDANNDNQTVGSGDEFVELVNQSAEDIDISGWQLWDRIGDKYTFPSGTVIPAGRAFVVFADPAQGTSYGGALLYSAGSLGLNNSGDDVILKDPNGISIDEVIGFSGSASDESLTRKEDGSFEKHTIVDTEGDSPYSPGTKVNGDSFGSKHAIAIRGTEGWRMISSPVESASFEDLFGGFWMQGVPGSDAPNDDGTLFFWTESEGGSYTLPTQMDESMLAGKGYFVYVFEDDEYNTPGIQGGFPKNINSDGVENGTVSNIPVSATDASNNGSIDNEEGYNLLGNPFDTDIKASAVLTALETVHSDVNGNIYVYDHDGDGGGGDWVTLSGDDTIAPFQGFFVRFGETAVDVSGTVSFSKSDLEANTGTDFYKNVADNAFQLGIELHGDQYFDTYTVAFNDKGTTDLDRYDAYKLFSLNPNSINLFSTLSNNRLQKNVLPLDMESKLEVPLSFEAGDRESLTFRWDNGEQLPSGWQFTLIDKQMNRQIDMRINNEYQFNRMISGQEKPSDEKTLLNKSNGEDEEARFVLAIQPKQTQVGSNELPESAKLNPNYPNPFNPQTTIPYELAEDAEVKLTVWNMIGQKVATLVEGLVEAGTHEESWNASSMPSGIYIARFEVGGEVFIRKMTLIK